MLLKRYNNIEFVLNLDAGEGVSIINESLRQSQIDKLWDMYLVIYPNFSADNFVNFGEYCDMCLAKPEHINVSNKTEEEIMTDVEDILNTFKN